MSEPPTIPSNTTLMGTNNEPRATSHEEDEISLLDLLIVLAKHKKLIIGLPAMVAVLAAAISLLMPNIYTATTKILPPQQSQSVSNLGAQLGALAGLAGGFASTGSSALYIAILESRTIADRMTQRFGLNNLSELESSRARHSLGWKVRIKADKGGFINIEVDDENPRRASELANAYVDELLKFTTGIALTEASQRRLFFERQLALAKDNLDKAEISAKRALERGGLASADNQGSTLVQSAAQLRAQITVKEVQIGAMRTFATDRNPELQRAQQELESIKRELARIEGVGGINDTTKGTSGNAFDSRRLLSELKYAETMYDLLARQYELAKIDEAKDAPVIQVIDMAIEPEGESGPKRSLIVLLSAMGALFMGILWAVVREAIARASRDAQQAERLQSLKRYLAWRRIA